MSTKWHSLATWCILGALALGGQAYAGPVQVISDRSQFVGDFTVIDFETRGDGTPITLDPGRVFRFSPNEYAAKGVNIEPSGLGFPPEIVNPLPSAQFQIAHAIAGSAPNYLSDGSRNDFIRFVFTIPVNAVGIAVFNNADAGPVFLEVYDNKDRFIDFVYFGGDLIDGIVPGADFGDGPDLTYGFFGLYSFDVLIGSAILHEDLTAFDDLHFGIIPLPGTVAFLLPAVLFLVGRRRRVQAAFTVACAACLNLSIGSDVEAQTIRGRVEGNVVLSERPICGAIPPPGCGDPLFTTVPLENVLVCVEGGPCHPTDPLGEYTIPWSGPPAVVTATLAGPTARAGSYTAE